MRTHRTYEILAPWSTGAPVLDPARLAAVRIEPVLRQRKAAFALDFYLAGEDGGTVIPTVFAEPATIIARDRDPLVWPRGTPGDDAFAFALGERVTPHLERLVLSGERVEEHVVEFAAAPCFAAARAAGCFGAAPLRDALTRLAPYAYARRFARGRTVRIDAPDALGGWALLRSIATAGVAPSRRDPAALAWYGEAPVSAAFAEVEIVASGEPGRFEHAACVLRFDGAGANRVDVVDPMPFDVDISFDPAEGPARRWFSVERAPEPVVRNVPDLAYAPSRGSSGRVAVLVGRSDANRLPGADTDEAGALAAALAAEGFDAFVAETPAEIGAVDLVHVIGTRDGRRVRAACDGARRAGIPVAIHAHDEDASNGGWWGAAVTRYCFEYGSDERDVEAYLGLLAKRAVTIGAARAGAAYAPGDAGVDEATAALRDASVVFAATEEEAQGIRLRTGRRGPILVVPPVVALAAPAPIGHLVGADPFALVHAPIGPLANQLLVARCAASAGIPLVLAGPVADASYLERIREFGGAGAIVLAGEPSPGVAAALRSAAAIAIDAAWIGDGGARLAAAVLAGAQLAVAGRRRFAAPGVVPHAFDPADAAGLTRALGAAWDGALRAVGKAPAAAVAALAPAAAVRAIVRGYAAIESVVT